MPRDASAVPGTCPTLSNGHGVTVTSPGTLSWRAPPRCHRPGTDPWGGVPVPQLSPDRGWGHDPVQGAKGTGQTQAVGTRVPSPLSPSQDGSGCAPAAACTHLEEDAGARHWVLNPPHSPGCPMAAGDTWVTQQRVRGPDPPTGAQLEGHPPKHRSFAGSPRCPPRTRAGQRHPALSPGFKTASDEIDNRPGTAATPAPATEEPGSAQPCHQPPGTGHCHPTAAQAGFIH